MATARANVSPKPVLRRLLPPLAVMLGLLIAGALWRHQIQMNERLDVYERLTRSGSHLAVAIYKEHLNRREWEESRRSLGQEADWDRLPRSVINYTTQGRRLPNVFAQALDSNHPGDRASLKAGRDISFEQKTWRVSAMPLADASGKEIGNLLIITDVTSEKAAFHEQMVLGGACGGRSRSLP